MYLRSFPGNIRVKEMKTIEICSWITAVFALTPIIWFVIALAQSYLTSNQVSLTINGVAASGVAVLVALIAREVKKQGVPFVKKITTYLNVMQGWTYLVALASAFANFAQGKAGNMMDALGFQFVAIWFIGVAIGIFARIY